MASQLEIQIEQKKRLYMLLSIKAENKGMEIVALDRKIAETRAEMQQEDVAWVEKEIALFYKI
jgi:hypothetical protein